MRGGLGLSLMAIFVVNACSPQAYNREVAAFAEGVDHSVTGMSLLLDDLARDRLAMERARLAEARPRIGLDERCGEGIAELADNQRLQAIQAVARDLGERCQLQQLGDQPPLAGATQERGIDAAIADILPGGQTLALMDVLKRYSVALLEIAGSQDQLELDTALEKAQSSFGELTCTVRGGCPPSDGEAVGLAGSLIRNRVIDVLDHRRYRSLRDIVHRADGAIQMAVLELERLQSIAVGIRAQKALTELGDALGELALSDHQEGWLLAHEALLERRAVLIATLEQGGLDVFRQMGGAHRALKLALDDPKRGLDDLRVQLAAFTKTARELAAIHL